MCWYPQLRNGVSLRMDASAIAFDAGAIVQPDTRPIVANRIDLAEFGIGNQGAYRPALARR